MSAFLFDPPSPVTLSVLGQQTRFPVNRVFCVGRNYAAHAREMGMDERDPPFFFMKPPSAVVDCSVEVGIPYPPMTSNFHHEVELVAAIGREGFEIPQGRALDCVYGYAVGLDMTRRDLQFQARDKGRPWDFGKAFACSAPIGPITPSSTVGHLQSGSIELSVNDRIRQRSDLNLMIWNVAESIAFLSRYERLLPGDLIMTGTPEGVGPVVAGDVMDARIEGLAGIRVRVLPRSAD